VKGTREPNHVAQRQIAQAEFDASHIRSVQLSFVSELRLAPTVLVPQCANAPTENLCFGRCRRLSSTLRTHVEMVAGGRRWRRLRIRNSPSRRAMDGSSHSRARNVRPDWGRAGDFGTVPRTSGNAQCHDRHIVEPALCAGQLDERRG